MKALSLSAVLALLLTGCGASTGTSTAPTEAPSPEGTVVDVAPTTEPATEAPEPVLSGPGTYTLDTPYGTTGTLEIPGEPVQEVEELREQVGAEPVTYITADIDNRNGTEPFDLYELSIFDPEGQVHTYTAASDYVSEIRPGDAPAEIYNRYIDVGNSLTTLVDPLQRTTVVLVGPPVPEEITGVSVSSGFESFDLTPQ